MEFISFWDTLLDREGPAGPTQAMGPHGGSTPLRLGRFRWRMCSTLRLDGDFHGWGRGARWVFVPPKKGRKTHGKTIHKCTGIEHVFLKKCIEKILESGMGVISIYVLMIFRVLTVLTPESFIFSIGFGVQNSLVFARWKFFSRKSAQENQAFHATYTIDTVRRLVASFQDDPTIISFAKSSCLTQRNANGARMHTDAPTHPILL